MLSRIKISPFQFLMTFTLLLVNFISSAQASTDTTHIGISVSVQNPCQLSIGGQLNESLSNCQLTDLEFNNKLVQQKTIKTRQQTVTQSDGSLSMRVSITAP